MSVNPSLNLCPHCKTVLKPNETICSLCLAKNKGKGGGKFRRWLLGIMAIIFLFGGLRCWWGQDGPPPKDGDLKIKRVSIHPEKNAYVFLEKASEELGEMSEKEVSLLEELSKRKKWDDKKVAHFLQTNKNAMTTYRKGIQCSQGIWPRPKRVTVTVKLPNLLNLRRLGQLASIKRWQLFTSGKEKKALKQFRKNEVVFP